MRRLEWTSGSAKNRIFNADRSRYLQNLNFRRENDVFHICSYSELSTQRMAATGVATARYNDFGTSVTLFRLPGTPTAPDACTCAPIAACALACVCNSYSGCSFRWYPACCSTSIRCRIAINSGASGESFSLSGSLKIGS
jgi:hypothetical protein